MHTARLLRITGGNKIMMLAAYELALAHGCEMVYYQTDKTTGGIIYRYQVEDGHLAAAPREEAANAVLDIPTYFRAYGVEGDWTATGSARTLEQKVADTGHQIEELQAEEQAASTTKARLTAKNKRQGTEGMLRGHQFELAVYKALASLRAEGQLDDLCLGVPLKGIEIDLLLQRGNVVAIAEVKSGKQARGRQGIDQLVTAGGQPFGAYTQKLFISDLDPAADGQFPIEQFRPFIAAYRIAHCELPSFRQTGCLDAADSAKLRACALRTLGGLGAR